MILKGGGYFHPLNYYLGIKIGIKKIGFSIDSSSSMEIEFEECVIRAEIYRIGIQLPEREQ